MKNRVIHIIGKGRSGSTFLGDFLGSLPNVFHVGELDNLWKHNIINGSGCACHAPLDQCAVWTAISNHALADDRCAWAFRNPEHMLKLQGRWLSFHGVFISKLLNRDPKKYLDTMDGLYAAIHAATGKETIIDSSKWPLNPRFFSQPHRSGTEVVHLIRNPWAVADSWRSDKEMPDLGKLMPTNCKLHSSLSWGARVISAEAVRRKVGLAGHKVYLEEILAAPEETLIKLAESLELTGANQIIAGSTAHLAQSHAAFGNPSRFRSGAVTIQSESNIKHSKNWLVTVVTAPTRWLVGY